MANFEATAVIVVLVVIVAAGDLFQGGTVKY